ncbi:hydroxyacylglutathione hydrolase [Herbaspirillum sp. YR522]|uniref:hydroxyacylglutathione hydrolase n=1 Tax=Herbaspirillum sp. YR522 TaxID=1144342 RepID=UPI00026F64C2|nr:hydroxyacylglutathione hydrolase [Herbaspirillum sp. YR522]EJN09325.1 hydroxyacylglutathione hydrolase [Herbaspirillum sp. YR522]
MTEQPATPATRDPKSALAVLAVPAFDDNYLWLIHDGHQAAVVDPGDAAPVLAALAANRLTLGAILLTHHHADHVGGVLELAGAYPGLPVYGPARESIAGVTHRLAEGDEVELPQWQLIFKVIDVPGHTSGHIAYHAASASMLFCGDTLFAGGCGRIFEGTPAQMSQSLARLASLPPATAVYCAHEYTLSNLRFAAVVEPGNAALHERIAFETAKRQRQQPTVPSTVGLERSTNPFLRCGQAEIIESLQKAGRLQNMDEVAVFAALREWKNVYK